MMRSRSCAACKENKKSKMQNNSGLKRKSWSKTMAVLQLSFVLFIISTPCYVHGSLKENDFVLNMHEKREHTTWMNKDVKEEPQFTKVHIVFMNHLDVGYDGILPEIGFINTILNRYFHVYFPRAISVADQLIQGGYLETFIYTTHPWLVTMYLDCPPNLVLAGVQLQCPNASQVAAFKKKVQSGHITWHGGPMNMQSEFMDESLLKFGLLISQGLDKRFNITRNFRVYNDRDVPGLTQTVIPTLVKNGVDGVAVGVNPMSSPPAVPHNTVFRWKYGKDEVLAMWHPGGYPNVPGDSPANPGGLSKKDCTTVDGHPEVLCYAFRGDNDGPPKSVEEVLGYYAILRKEFPNAQLTASKMESFFEGVRPLRNKLPVVDKEVGDTWIMGVSSDPRKTAEYRAASRIMAKCLQNGRCVYEDHRVLNASRFLIKMAEHTWGLPSVYDNANWTNAAFNQARKGPNYKNCTLSWIEQREFMNLTLSALGNHSAANEINQEISLIEPRYPDLSGYIRAENQMHSRETICHADGQKFVYGFSHEGGLDTLMYNGTQWASSTNQLGKLLYITYNASDFGKFASVYNYMPITAGFNKENVTRFAKPDSRSWPVNSDAIYQKSDGSCDFWLHIHLLDKRPVVDYGAPQDVWVHYTGRAAVTPGVDVELMWFDKTSTRLPESIMFEFKPAMKQDYQFYVSKVNKMIDPTHVILNGSSYLHALDEDGLYYIIPTQAAGLRVSSLDVALLSPITDKQGPMSYAMPLKPIQDTITGAAFNIYNNVWDTNYIFWYPYLREDKDFKARFSVDIIVPGSTESLKLHKKLSDMKA